MQRPFPIEQQIRRHTTFLSWMCGVLFVVAVGSYTMVKYASASYNALDLGIFAQVVNGLAHGKWFAFTIHPHSYLGDHMDLFLLLLAPLLWVFRHPAQTLLVTQSIALALSLWPLTLLARRHLSSLWALGIAALFLLNPSIHNLALFEFHELAFAVPLLLTAVLFYEEKKFWRYCVVLLFVMVLREDLGLVLAGMGILALFDRRAKRWWLPPLLFGVAWFVLATRETGVINGEHYKFLAYYGWLGDSPQAIIHTVLARPWIVLAKLLRLQNIAFVFALLLQFSLLPLFALRRLLPIIGIVLALFLTGFGADALTLYTHYPALLLPFLFWGSIVGLQRILGKPHPRLRAYADHPRPFIAFLIAVISVYGLMTFSPFRPAGIRALANASRDPLTAAYHEMVSQVPKDAHIAASFSSLPFFADHAFLYSLHYQFRGRRQLSSTPYEIPTDADWALYDARDSLFYNVQYQHEPDIFSGGSAWLRSLLARGFNLVALHDSLLLFAKSEPTGDPVWKENVVAPHAFTDNTERVIRLLATDQQDTTLKTETDALSGKTFGILPLSLTWQATEKLDQSYYLIIQYRDGRGNIRATTRFPIGYGLYPTNDWPAQTPLTFTYRWLLPPLKKGAYTVRLTIATTEGYATLDPKLSAMVQRTKETKLDPPIELGSVTIQ